MNAPSESIIRKRAARLGAVQVLYQIDMKAGEETPDTAIRHLSHQLLEGREEKDEEESLTLDPDMKFLRKIVEGAHAAQEKLDPLLTASLSKERQISGLPMLIRAILRAAAWEMLERTQTSPKIIIDEYVSIAHEFLEPAEAGLVNAALETLARNKPAAH